MNMKLNKEQVISLIEKIQNSEGTEQEIDDKIELLKKNVPDPNVSNLIFWSEEGYSAEQIYEMAMSYKPIV
ncbi:hypothetical protein [Saccharibacillus sp. JS10]|uniref:hypothetical protein n=1 Tax=Saccharibacillus sp. JS10 TaxID=2950552 RepID=UPI00210F2241|nr:hypothetical protein [Saccharibacillus sp. JS10]MCQ4088409.1 hypothetical protein [Saccharibacillus sp. JS10]